ncbi:hypothetical protein [Diaphorobacter caeni]|uniref:hypothetical protein n=1 Tax=Diaphorobacter caeni TaxID=2784387 RepID=UPI00189016BC|nr:hypothetical protein [Diaphorobacter caeni]MBF5006630.1 hypothetical protein [Diaphorobacter caeni]
MTSLERLAISIEKDSHRHRPAFCTGLQVRDLLAWTSGAFAYKPSADDVPTMKTSEEVRTTADLSRYTARCVAPCYFKKEVFLCLSKILSNNNRTLTNSSPVRVSKTPASSSKARDKSNRDNLVSKTRSSSLNSNAEALNS